MKSKMTQNQCRLWLKLFAATILIAGTVIGNSPEGWWLPSQKPLPKKPSPQFEECRKIITGKTRNVETMKAEEEKLSKLLAQYKEVRFEKDGEFDASLLHWAASEARPDLVEVLLRSYDTDAIKQLPMIEWNKYKSTPLHMAAFEQVNEKILGHHKALKEVAKHFLECEWTKGWLSLADADGNTPLHVAVARRNKSVIELLIANASQPNLAARNNDRATPLHEAAKRGNFKAVWLLLDKGAQVNDLNKAGDNSLTLAVRGYFEEKKNKPDSPLLAEYRKIVRLLLAKGLDDSDARKKLAIQAGAMEWLDSVKPTAPPLKPEEMLAKLNAGEIAAELMQVDYSQPKPRWNLDIDCINELFSRLESKQSIAATPAAKPKSQLKAAIKPSDVLLAQDEDGNTLLHLAAKYEREDLIVLFLAYGDRSLLTRKNASEETALSLAKFQTPWLEKAVRLLVNDGSKTPAQK